jgi:hypothetical protein
MLPRAFAKGIRTMKNLKKLGLILSVGTIAAFSLVGCGDDDDSTGGTAGTGGSGTAGSGTAGSGTAGSGTAGSGTAGSGTAGSGTAGSGGSGTAGSGGSATGGTGGSGGASGGSGGKGGSGGSGGSGGASGGSGGSGGAAPSADCKKWCQGTNGLIQQCAGKLAAAVDTEAKCLAECDNDAAKGDKGLTCWNTHLAFIVGGMSKDTHCPHASGAPGNGACNETK